MPVTCLAGVSKLIAPAKQYRYCTATTITIDELDIRAGVFYANVERQAERIVMQIKMTAFACNQRPD